MEWLSLSIWLPIIFGVVLLSLPSERYGVYYRWIAFAGALLSFLVTVPLYTGFRLDTADMQFVEKVSWIPRYNVNYHLGVDGISLWFVLLTAFITIVAVLGGWNAEKERIRQYFASFLILSGLMVGVFVSLDGLLFYVFFEATLIPMYLIIGIWGGPRRIYAAFKFFLYTLLGSLLTLVAFVYLYSRAGGNFNILSWHGLPLSQSAQTWLFFALFAAFAVKVPMWPVHTWLPDVHVEAPTSGSVVLAAVMLKLGAYGFLRFSIPVLPDASRQWSSLMIVLSLVALIYVGLVTLVQSDMKKLVAYSSVAHMGFVTLGFFMFDAVSLSGAVVQMVAHGFVSAAMFICIGVLYDRVHSREISNYGGVATTMPRFSAFAVLFAMANCGLPGTAGFVGEWMVIIGAVKLNFWIGLAAATALITGAAYSLWVVKRVYFGPVASEAVRSLTDIGMREFLILFMLAIAVLWMGVYPKPVTDVMNASVDRLLLQASMTKAN